MEIYNYIVNYYPLGISKDLELFESYKGIKKLREITKEKHNPKNDTFQLWGKFIQKVKDQIPDAEKVASDTNILDPCYCNYLVLERDKGKYIGLVRELYVYISLISPYFTIFGMDSAYTIEQNSPKLNFNPIITNSPSGIYESPFKQLRLMMEAAYPEYNFYSIKTLSQKISGLSVSGLNPNAGGDTIFQALFTDKKMDNLVMGDLLYS